MKPARFFFLDARAAWPFVVVLLHLRWYTLCFAAITTLIFYIMEMRGLNFVAALRAFRVWLVTRKRPAVRHSDHTRLVDFGFEPAVERVRSDAPAGAPKPAAGKPAVQGKGSKTAPGKAGNASRTGAAKANQGAAAPRAKTVRPKPAPAKSQ